MGARLLLEGALYAVYLRTRTSGCSLECAVSFEARRIRRNVGKLLAAAKADEQKSFVHGLSADSELMRLFGRPGYRLALNRLANGELTPKRWRWILRLGRILEIFSRRNHMIDGDGGK